MKRLTTMRAEDFALEYVFGIWIYGFLLIFITHCLSELLCFFKKLSANNRLVSIPYNNIIIGISRYLFVPFY